MKTYKITIELTPSGISENYCDGIDANDAVDNLMKKANEFNPEYVRLFLSGKVKSAVAYCEICGDDDRDDDTIQIRPDDVQRCDNCQNEKDEQDEDDEARQRQDDEYSWTQDQDTGEFIRGKNENDYERFYER